jgi:(R)-2-hydroxyacyl-CoA dehydratese activating ATPase
MKSAGIDIGSRTVKLVIVENSRFLHFVIRENTFDPLSLCKEMMAGLEFDRIIATGYGRHLFAGKFKCDIISEIKAFSIGARARFPSCRTILDIGGQDIKAISLDSDGRMCKFEMNDKCSAGTGRFLEIMAMALGCSLADFSNIALTAQKSEKINSMCTVFAESEVISLLAKGARREDVALGIHLAIMNKARAMVHRVSIQPDLVFVGGVARNKCVAKLLEDTLKLPVHIPDDPQIIGALGCALHGEFT